MATPTRKTDANMNRTTDTYPDGKQYHYFKGDPLLENFVIVQSPSGLCVKRPANGTHPDVLEQQRVDTIPDFTYGGTFTDTERKDWNKVVFWSHIVLPGILDFVEDSNAWTDARQDDGVVGSLRAYGIDFTTAQTLDSDIRSVYEALPGNQRSASPSGSLDPPSTFWIDRTFSLTASKEIQQLSLFSNHIISSFNLKIVERTATETYDVILETEDLAHGGTGWENFNIPTYQVPAAGTFHVGAWLPSAVSDIERNTGTDRSRSTTEPSGDDNTITETNGVCPAVGVRFENDYPYPSDMGFGTGDIPVKFRKIFEALG